MPELQPFGRVDRATSSVDLRCMLSADTVTVWQALTEAQHTIAWIGRLVGGPIGPGSRFSLWHDHEARSDHVVVRWDAGRCLQLTWDFPGEPTSRLAFELRPRSGRDPGASLLRVLHTQLADPWSYAAGWHRHLDHLDAHLRGSDLPMERFWDGYDDLLALYRSGYEATARDVTAGTTARTAPSTQQVSAP